MAPKGRKSKSAAPKVDSPKGEASGKKKTFKRMLSASSVSSKASRKGSRPSSAGSSMSEVRSRRLSKCSTFSEMDNAGEDNFYNRDKILHEVFQKSVMDGRISLLLPHYKKGAKNRRRISRIEEHEDAESVISHGKDSEASKSDVFLEAQKTEKDFAAFSQLFEDVPTEHLGEAHEILATVRTLDPEVFGIDGLRAQLANLKRMGGFSRAVTAELITVLFDALSLPSSGGVSRATMQRAFARMDGVKTLMNLLMLRQSVDEGPIVAQLFHLLTAAVSGSPLAAEAMLEVGAGGNNILLLMRIFERHLHNPEVTIQVCALVGNLCSTLPQATGDPLNARPRAYTSSQAMVVECGVIDLLIELLHKSVKDLARLEATANESRPVASSAAADATPKGGYASRRSFFVKQNSMSRTPTQPSAATTDFSAWNALAKVEVTEGALQEAALQALLLVAAGNKETMRTLAGSLWTFHKVVNAEAAAKRQEEQEQLAARSKQHAKNKGKGKGKVVGKRTPEEELHALLEAEDAPSEGSTRYKMQTLGSFARYTALLSQVLLGHAAKDRPALAAKACRIISLLCDLVLREATEVEHHSKARAMVTQVHRAADDTGSLPESLFGLLSFNVHALMHSLRMHRLDIPFLTAALETFGKIRQVAFRTLPAGFTEANPDVARAWCRLLASFQLEGELQKAAIAMEDSMQVTDIGNRRMLFAQKAHFASTIGNDITSHDLEGDGSWMTPRTRAKADQMRQIALELASDAMSVSWERGQPGRKALYETAKAEQEALALAAAEALAPQSERGSQASVDISGWNKSTKGKKHRRRAFTDSDSEHENDDDAEENAEEIEGAEFADAHRGRFDFDAEDECMKIEPYTRALGYMKHDEADFDRVWRQPLEHVLSRSFARHALVKPSKGRSYLPLPPSALEPPPDRPPFELKMLDSQPGKLRVKLSVFPNNRVEQRVGEQRMQQMIENKSCTEVFTQEVTKILRTNGVLMPVYGIKTIVKKGRETQSAPSLAVLEHKAADNSPTPSMLMRKRPSLTGGSLSAMVKQSARKTLPARGGLTGKQSVTNLPSL